MNKAQLTGRIARWILLLSEFDYKVVYNPGKSHLVPDCLSRSNNGENPDGVDDTLPDHNLYALSVEHTSPVKRDERDLPVEPVTSLELIQVFPHLH